MKIFCTFPTVNISKLNFWLVICIAKNFIWTTLKVIFSIFRFFCTLRFQIYKYCPIITNHTSMQRLFIQLSDDAYISISEYWLLWLVLWSLVTNHPNIDRSTASHHTLHFTIIHNTFKTCKKQSYQLLQNSIF